jgi:type IV pilus assembly protein PilQ
MAGKRKLAMILISSLLLSVLSIPSSAAASMINDIEVIRKSGSLTLEISKTGDVNFNAFMLDNPARLVVDCVGAAHNVGWTNKEVDSGIAHRVRTNQFQLEPVMISRIVVDLKGEVDYRMWDDGDRQILEVSSADSGWEGSIPSKESSRSVSKASKATPERVTEDNEKLSGSMSSAATGPVLPVLPLVNLEDEDNDKQNTGKSAEAEKKDTDRAGPWIDKSDQVHISKTQETEKPKEKDSPWLDVRSTESTSTSSSSPDGDSATKGSSYSVSSKVSQDNRQVLPWSQNYMRGAPASGGGMGMGARRINIDAQGADIKTVLRTISEFAGVNIVAGSKVEGEVFVHIKDAPWEEALEILLKAHGYGYRKEFGMIRVAEAARLRKEELDKQTAEKKKEDLLPLVNEIIFVDNSNAEEIADAMEKILSDRGKISVDRGSNAIVIKDIEKRIAKIKDMVDQLDKKSYQVDINAKLVEIDVQASRELGINWSMLNLHKSDMSATGSMEVNENIAVSSGTVKFGTVRSWGELTAILQVLEKENKANIISNPRITTMDNREAEIIVGKEIPLIVSDEAGNPITELTKIGIMLKVIPHVNADRTVTLDLHPEVSELQSESTEQGGVIIATSEADTRVVVEDGETAVIGGLIKNVESTFKQGVPVLKDLPVVGGLFSSTTVANSKQELVIFVTPSIVE